MKPQFTLVPRDQQFNKTKADIRAFAFSEWGMSGLTDMLDAVTEMVLVHGLALNHSGHLVYQRTTCVECLPRREELFLRERACRIYNILIDRLNVEGVGRLNDHILLTVAHAALDVPGGVVRDLAWAYRAIAEHGTVEIAAGKGLDRIGCYGKTPSATAVRLARVASSIEYDGTETQWMHDPEIVALEQASGLKPRGTVTGRLSSKDSGNTPKPATKPGDIKALFGGRPEYAVGFPAPKEIVAPFRPEEFEVGHIIASFGLCQDHPGFKEPRRPAPEDKSTGRQYKVRVDTTDTPEGRDRKARLVRLLKTLPEQVDDKTAWDLFSRRAREIKLEVLRHSGAPALWLELADELDIPAYRITARYGIDCLDTEDAPTAWALLRARILSLP